VTKWEEEFRRKEKLMRSMSEFPQFYQSPDKQASSLTRKRHVGKLPTIQKQKKKITKCKLL